MTIRAYLKEIWGPEASKCEGCGVTWGALHMPDCPLMLANAGAKAPPKPKLASVKTAPTAEDFAAWRDHPVTQFVFAAYRHAADELRDEWVRSSWEGGVADQKVLDRNLVRADSYRALEESDYLAFCETLGLEPRGED